MRTWRRATPDGAGVDRAAREGIEKQASATTAVFASRSLPQATGRGNVTRRL
jgi:hypothetical protein